jgi:hypothetical protein
MSRVCDYAVYEGCGRMLRRCCERKAETVAGSLPQEKAWSTAGRERASRDQRSKRELDWRVESGNQNVSTQSRNDSARRWLRL